MTPQEMRTLYDYNAWANHRSLDAASALTTEQFVQPMGSSFGSVRDTLALRERPMVRFLHLGGTAALPTYFEIAEREASPEVGRR